MTTKCPAHPRNQSSSIRTSAVALVNYGIGINAWTVDMPVRRLSDLAGVSRATASRHIDRFKSIGLVTRLEHRGKGHGRRLHIDVDYDPPSNTKVVTTETYNMQELICLTSDHLLWTAHGLGQTAYRVFVVLSPFPGSVADVVRATGLVRNTVNKHLGALVKLGLAIEVPGSRKRYALNLVPDIEHALAASGAVEKQQEKRVQYEQDRQAYSDYRAAHPESPEVLDPPVEKRPMIDGALASNGWTSDIFALDQRLFRINAAGLEAMRNTAYDDLLGWHPWNPPEGYREYKEPPLPGRKGPAPDPFAAASRWDDEPPF